MPASRKPAPQTSHNLDLPVGSPDELGASDPAMPP
jgi:hypothetical protein